MGLGVPQLGPSYAPVQTARTVAEYTGGLAFRTYSRIASAGAYAGEVRDIDVTAAASVERDADGSQTVVTEVRIDPSRLALSLTDGRRKGSLAVTVFVGDRHESVLGDAWETMGLNLSEATWRRMLEDGVRHTVRVGVQDRPRYVKVVVYDTVGDLAGTAAARIR